jgi:NAD-dependent deacetylase
VLWFDECYDEPLFRYDSTLAAARAAAILVVVGTSGGTSLPARMCQVAADRGTPLVVVDPAPTPLAELAQASGRGVFMPGTACAVVPELARALVAVVGAGRSDSR